MCEPFTVEDMEIIFYAAQTALADAETFDNIAKHFDIFDDDMFKLRERPYVNTLTLRERQTMGIGIRHVRRKQRDRLGKACAFLINKIIDMDLKTKDGNDICPMFGFCDDCETSDDCFMDGFMHLPSVATRRNPE